MTDPIDSDKLLESTITNDSDMDYIQTLDLLGPEYLPGAHFKYQATRLWTIRGMFRDMLNRLKQSKTPPFLTNYEDMSFELKKTIAIVSALKPVYRSKYPLVNHMDMACPNREAWIIPTDAQLNTIKGLLTTYENGVSIGEDHSVKLVDLIFCYKDIIPVLGCASEPPVWTNYSDNSFGYFRTEPQGLTPKPETKSRYPLKEHLELTQLDYTEKLILTATQVDILRELNLIKMYQLSSDIFFLNSVRLIHLCMIKKYIQHLKSSQVPPISTNYSDSSFGFVSTVPTGITEHIDTHTRYALSRHLEMTGLRGSEYLLLTGEQVADIKIALTNAKYYQPEIIFKTVIYETH